ncbi:MAG: hypothetical protein J6S02_08475 [Bacteroidaceae bacterium]|nr:hypothetical protein [Bacteroidaceae bacterium]
MDNNVSQCNSAFQELTFWQRVKILYSFIWKNKLAFVKFTFPIYALMIVFSIIESWAEDVMTGVLSICTFALLNIYKKEGHLNQVTLNKFSTSTGEIFLSSLVYGIICFLCLIIPIIIGAIFIIGNPVLGSIVCALFFIPFFIISGFGYFRMLWHDPNNEGFFKHIKYAWRLMKGNWLNTLAYHFVSYLTITIISWGIPLIIWAIVGAWAELQYGIDFTDEYTDLTMAAPLFLLLYFGFIQLYLPTFFQFEYLQHKYEKKLKDNPEEDNYKGDPLYRLINEED